MVKKHDINNLILEEIDSLNEQQNIRDFLKEILDFEINNIGEKHFTEGYQKLVDKSLENIKKDKK